MDKRVEKLLLNVSVALGGVVGAWCRYFVGTLFSSPTFPYATLIVNIVGSTVIGVLVALVIEGKFISEYWRVFIVVGFCGGLTTFSSFSLETFKLFSLGHWPMALLNIIANVILSFLAVALGYASVLKLKLSNN